MTALMQKRDAILKAALNLIAANGFHGTPMSLVAKEAGVSAGIIYHYFESKDALIDELYRVVKQDFARAILANHQPDASIQQQLYQLERGVIRYFMAHPQETIFMEQYMKSPYNSPAVQAQIDEQFAPVDALIRRAQAEGLVKELPVQVLHSLTLDVASAIVQKHNAGLLDLNDAVIEQIVAACWDAVRR